MTPTPILGFSHRIIHSRSIQALVWGLWLVVSIWFQVLFHSSFRGTFHLSLTVLVHYRSRKIFNLGRRSSHLPTSLHVASSTFPQPWMIEKNYDSLSLPFVYGAVTLFGCPFQVPSTRINLLAIIRQFPFRSPLLGKSHTNASPRMEATSVSHWKVSVVFFSFGY